MGVPDICISHFLPSSLSMAFRTARCSPLLEDYNLPSAVTCVESINHSTRILATEFPNTGGLPNSLPPDDCIPIPMLMNSQKPLVHMSELPCRRSRPIATQPRLAPSYQHPIEKVLKLSACHFMPTQLLRNGLRRPVLIWYACSSEGITWATNDGDDGPRFANQC